MIGTITIKMKLIDITRVIKPQVEEPFKQLVETHFPLETPLGFLQLQQIKLQLIVRQLLKLDQPQQHKVHKQQLKQVQMLLVKVLHKLLLKLQIKLQLKVPQLQWSQEMVV